MLRKILITSTTLGALCFSVQGAYALEAPYSGKVPDLLGDLLKTRGASEAAIQGTKQGVASVVAADAAAAGKTLSNFRWLTTIARANRIGAGISAVALVADLAYNYFFGQDEMVTERPAVKSNIVDMTGGVAGFKQRYPHPVQTFDIIGWRSTNYTCEPTDTTSCAAGEAWLALRDWWDRQSARNEDSFKRFKMLTENIAVQCLPFNSASIRCSAGVQYEYYTKTASGDERRTAIFQGYGDQHPVWAEEPEPVNPECELSPDLPYCGTLPAVELPDTPAYPLTEKPQTIPDEHADKDANPDALAPFYNDLWERAAQMANYQGVPYDYDRPLTTEDMHAQRTQNPTGWPSLADMAAPIANPSNGELPWTGTNPGTNPDPGTGPGTDPGTDPGTNPGSGGGNAPDGWYDNPVQTSLPEVPQPPTIEEIMGPVMAVFPGLRNIQVNLAGGQCPKPEIAVFEKTFTMDAHCTLFEQVKPSLSVAFVMLWGITSVLIVLRA